MHSKLQTGKFHNVWGYHEPKPTDTDERSIKKILDCAKKLVSSENIPEIVELIIKITKINWNIENLEFFKHFVLDYIKTLSSTEAFIQLECFPKNSYKDHKVFIDQVMKNSLDLVPLSSPDYILQSIRNIDKIGSKVPYKYLGYFESISSDCLKNYSNFEFFEIYWILCKNNMISHELSKIAISK